MATLVNAERKAQAAITPPALLGRVVSVRIALIVCILAAFALYTSMLDAKSLWLDEVLTVQTVDADRPRLARRIGLRESLVPLAIVAATAGIAGLVLLGWMLRHYGNRLAEYRSARWVRATLIAAFRPSLVVLVAPRGYTAKRQLLILWPFVLLLLGWVWPWQRRGWSNMEFLSKRLRSIEFMSNCLRCVEFQGLAQRNSSRHHNRNTT